MYKILLLSDVNSSHTQKWALALAEKGFQVAVFSLNPLSTKVFEGNKNVAVYAKSNIKKGAFNRAVFYKSGYLRALPLLKKAIEEFKPDIVHAHYASSYGLLGRLSRFHPFIISVWGSDVFDFPKKNPVTKRVLKKNLGAADYILSTSHIMAKETASYTDKPIEVIPFGIDLNKFKMEKGKLFFEDDNLVIGTVKTLEKNYNIDVLIKAFAQVHKDFLKARLLIVGEGSQRSELEKLVKTLYIENAVRFTGYVPSGEIAGYHNAIDIFVNVSRHESFGVSVIEASACGKPVIVSNVGGLTEVVENNVTGIMVPTGEVEALSKAIKQLLKNEALRKELGMNGRKRVEQLYNWNDNIKQMITVYEKSMQGKNE